MDIERVLLIRHGLSTANADPNVYRTTPDHCIPLADPVGDIACERAGAFVGALGLAPETVCTWLSPYLRCMQTERIVMQRAFEFHNANMFRRESFLLREQEFGDWDGLTEAEIERVDPTRFALRQRLTDSFGRFYFRYPRGESRADVCMRLTMFIGKMHRSSFKNHVVFLHGVTERAFRMAWFNRPVEWFEHEPNPKNGQLRLISRVSAGGAWQEQLLATP